MSTFSTILLIAIVIILGFVGYYYLDNIAPLQSSLKEQQLKNQELIFKVEQLERKNADLAQQLEEKIQEISQEKQEEINRLKLTYEDLISELTEQIDKGEITITRLADQLKVNIVDRIIFPSGKAELSEDGIKVLKRVGNILKEVKDKQIRVEGHTDNVPIHRNLKGLYPTNWELSVARATNVVRFLQEEIGIDARHLEATGLAEFRPIASNKSHKGRAQNRRIEILLLPQQKSQSKLTKK
ncbi:MAG: OmpA family protein [bacterium]